MAPAQSDWIVCEQQFSSLGTDFKKIVAPDFDRVLLIHERVFDLNRWIV